MDPVKGIILLWAGVLGRVLRGFKRMLGPLQCFFCFVLFVWFSKSFFTFTVECLNLIV